MNILESVKAFARRLRDARRIDDAIRSAALEIVREEPGVSLGNLVHLIRFAAFRYYGMKLERKRVNQIVGNLIDDGTLTFVRLKLRNVAKVTLLKLASRNTEGAGGGE